MKSWLKPSLNWLLVLIPIAAVLHFTHTSELAVFVCAGLSIIPLAGWMGHATEHLAHRTGAGFGGLLNATFGNAAEFIIAMVALSKGHLEIVKASLTGSIIGNILLVMGASFLVGGLKFHTQKFNTRRAGVGSSMLLIAAISLLIPTVYAMLSKNTTAMRTDLSLDISLVLLAIYGLSLLFEFRTHRRLLAPETQEESDSEEEALNVKQWSVRRSLLVLGVATALIAWMSEMLVSSVEHSAKAMGMNMVFVGVIVVAVIGNAAEHSTAILVARKNKMDLSFSIAVGSSIQVALFVAPVLVIAGKLMGQPMDLVFTPLEVVSVMVSVWIVNQVANDGETNWLEGCQLLAVYLILGMAFYFLPL